LEALLALMGITGTIQWQYYIEIIVEIVLYNLLTMILTSLEYQERRRRAVSENIPRLAFVTSDIVIFVGNESFANATYMKRVRKLVYDATESVDSAQSPALLLIYNKCSLDEEFDPDICTKQFFEKYVG
jgi:hypothetical protein